MSMTTNPFQKAVKAQLKARVAFDGPTGAGKTWTALSWATVLAGDEGRIAFIDTERDSAKLYAHRFDFDVLRFDPPYEVARLVEALKAAEANGYAVVVVDSLSHFWDGEGGVLDEVDAAANRNFSGSTFAGWKHGTPLQRHMVDTFLGLDMHVIVCMRSKMEYALEDYIDSKGQKKTRPVKIGMAPVQRAGLEYEFTIVGDMDEEHRITFSKSRCDVLGKTTVQPDREREAAETFLAWLNDGEPMASHAEVDALVALFDQIDDADERKASKRLFVECFGKPETLREGQLTDARTWVGERVAEIASAGEPASQQPPAAQEGGDGDQVRHLPAASREEPDEGSNGSVGAASPAHGEGSEEGDAVGEAGSPSTGCRLCGSTRAALTEDGVCRSENACEARQKLAG